MKHITLMLRCAAGLLMALAAETRAEALQEGPEWSPPEGAQVINARGTEGPLEQKKPWKMGGFKTYEWTREKNVADLIPSYRQKLADAECKWDCLGEPHETHLECIETFAKGEARSEGGAMCDIHELCDKVDITFRSERVESVAQKVSNTIGSSKSLDWNVEGNIGWSAGSAGGLGGGIKGGVGGSSEDSTSKTLALFHDRGKWMTGDGS